MSRGSILILHLNVLTSTSRAIIDAKVGRTDGSNKTESLADKHGHMQMARSSLFLGLRGNALSTAQTLLVVLPSFVLFGYNQSNIGGLVPLSDWTDNFPEIDTKHYTGAAKSQHATVQGVVIATFTLGAMFGCLSWSYTADKFGRRMVIFAGALLSRIGMVLECSAFQLAQLVVVRTVLGGGVGMLSGTVPTW